VRAGLYLVLRLVTWESMTLQPNLAFPFPVHVSGPKEGDDQPCGFLPVFLTRADALSWSEEGRFTIQEISIVQEAHP